MNLVWSTQLCHARIYQQAKGLFIKDVLSILAFLDPLPLLCLTLPCSIQTFLTPLPSLRSLIFQTKRFFCKKKSTFVFRFPLIFSVLHALSISGSSLFLFFNYLKMIQGSGSLFFLFFSLNSLKMIHTALTNFRQA